MSLGNTQYDALMRHYDEVRTRHRLEADERRAEVIEAVPEIKRLDDEIADLSVEAARARITSADADLSGFYSRLEEIAAERIAYLTKAGYPADYLEVKYDCPICRDTGYVDGQPCTCFKKAAIGLLAEKYSVSKVLEKENFSHFSFDCYSDKMKNEVTGLTARETARRAYDTARAFAGRIGQPDNNLLLYGNTGVGKTFLSHCIAADAISAGLSALYFSASDLFDVLADSSFGRSREPESAQDMILSCDLLVIDDLGTELTNSFVGSALFRVINDRILADRSTIISTNLMLDELSNRYSERIFSRITSHYRIIKLFGEDIRLQQKFGRA